MYNKDMTFVIDIDDTILLYPNKHYDNIEERYIDAKVDEKLKDAINKLFNAGNVIILHTGRNWDKYEITKNQLKEFDIKHTELVMGKPQGIYIDRDSYKTLEEYFKHV